MSELTLTLMRLGLLVMLWLFVFAVVGVLRSDLFGTRVSRRTRRRAAQTGVPVGAASASGYAAPAPSPHGAPPARQAARPAPARQSGRGGAGARGIPTSVAVTEGRLAGTVIPLTPAGILVGRNPECSLVLDDDFTSGRHLRLFLREGSWWVEDLGSTNGTFLDAARLTTAQPVGVGSVLRIGRTALELHG
ncbi:MAG TPA: FHA domain-containing protein [Dermatophilaceae bacterium]|nr:FHA domain-containing protein [Dermatophilaceae bacterium]